MQTTARSAKHLHWQVLIAVALGILTGHFWPALSTFCQPVSVAFIKAIRMLLAPLVFFHIVTGIGGMGRQRRLGGLQLKRPRIYTGYINSRPRYKSVYRALQNATSGRNRPEPVIRCNRQNPAITGHHVSRLIATEF